MRLRNMENNFNLGDKLKYTGDAVTREIIGLVVGVKKENGLTLYKLYIGNNDNLCGKWISEDFLQLVESLQPIIKRLTRIEGTWAVEFQDEKPSEVIFSIKLPKEAE